MSKPSPSIEVFKAGRHVALDGTEHEVTERDLLDAAEQYDPSVSEAPLVVGHPKLNAPAYGWAQRAFVKDGVLRVEPHQVDPAFAEMVNSGRFKKVSASFYLPTSPRNPKPGKFYLRHVGFLGAQPPSVKGLRDASFSESTEGVVEFGEFERWYVFREIANIFRRVRDSFVDRDGVEKADGLIPTWAIDSIAEAGQPPQTPQPVTSFAEFDSGEGSGLGSGAEASPPDQVAEFAEREAALTAQAEALQAREAALQEREQQTHRADIAAFCESLVIAGKMLPRQKSVIVELLSSESAGTEIEFAEGDQTVKKPRLAAWREFLAELPQIINFSEKSAGPIPGDSASGDVASFAAPADALVNSDRLELHHRALAYQTQNPNTPYLEAVQAVST